MVTAINLTAIIISSIALVTSVSALVLVLAQKWSSHKIEWRPLVSQEIEEQSNTELQEAVEEEDKILSSALHLQRKKKKAQEEDPMEDVFKSHNF